jgi:type II secretory pathway pseudopilin PulG
MLMDVIGGLILVAMLATVLAIAMNRQNRAQQKLADSRAAVRIAERVLADLQTSGKTAAADDDTRITIHRAEGAADARGLAWAEVHVAFRDQQASLVGLVPRKLLPAEGRAQ